MVCKEFSKKDKKRFLKYGKVLNYLGSLDCLETHIAKLTLDKMSEIGSKYLGVDKSNE